MSQYYENFIAEAERKNSQKENRKICNTYSYGISTYIDHLFSKKHLSHYLLSCVEKLDRLLITFDNQWQPYNGKKYWFTNYNDLLRGLRTIIWDKNIKNYFIDDPDSYLWNEIGLFSFLKREKVRNNPILPNIRFFEVNKIIVDTKQFLILGNENTINSLNDSGAVNIFITGIEQIVKNLDTAELYIQEKKEQFVSEGKKLYPIIYTPTSKNSDHLFIFDNMRSNVMQFPCQRKALACIHCGRCSQVCPVFRHVGPAAYDNIFSGPVANVLLPHLETIADYKFVSYACTLCGNCEKVCPVLLPLREMIIENRRFFYEKGHLSHSEKRKIKTTAKALANRKKLNKLWLVKKIRLKHKMSKSLRKHRKFPYFEKLTFNQQYIKKLKENYK